MMNFKVNFEYPWLLLLLIPALVLTLISYFRLKKRYRKTRNRIVSIVLHLVVMLLSITTLAGITFSYDIPNVENEILLLVDVSDSGDSVEEQRNEYVGEILQKSAKKYKVGVVTFGYDQVYAVPLNNEDSAASLYSSYINAPLPDTSATNIAGALQYAKTLVDNPEAAKIVLISDGVETDGKALSVIKSLAADGLKVDAAYIGEEYEGAEVEIVEITTPEYSLKAGVEFTLGVTLKSSVDGTATLTLYDESATGLTVSEPVQVTLAQDSEKTFELTHKFNFEGMHKLYVEVECYDDALKQNNVYHSYIYLEVFDKVLLVERTRDEANTLFELLKSEYNVEVKNINDKENFPSTLDELREYDQVVLMDIGKNDMTAEFETALHSYVYDVGGGVLTVGGYAGDDDTHSYDREDMYGTLYQQMLPVQAINYTPPIAVMFIIDRSGSMGEKDKSTGKTYLDLAKEAVRSCLENPDVFSERDWCGIMTLESYYNEDAEIMPIPQYKKLVRAVDSIELGGGTVYSGAIESAGNRLGALSGVERKHIIIVSDGLPSDSYDQYSEKIEECVAKDITLSIVALGISGQAAEDMKKAAKLGGGEFHNIYNVKELALKLTSELTQEEIKGVNFEEFQPTIKNRTAVVAGIDEDAIPTLTGYYGTKIKEGAEVPLMGEYVPIYAQWKYGAGSVGSFMCDLSSEAGAWSSNFVSSGTGIQLVNNIVGALFPTENIRVRDIDAEIKEDNYTSQLSVYTTLEKDESIQVTVTNPLLEGQTEPTKQVLAPSADKGFSRVQFETKTPGVYEILIEKKAADGSVIQNSTYKTYKTFSYSKEYNTFVDHAESKAMLGELAEDGDGTMLSDTAEIFAGFEKTLHREYDPRLPFIIAAIVLFLLDIAVRKFKFKWLHEIIRDRKNKKRKSA